MVGVSMEGEPSEEILNMIGDEMARRTIVALSEKPQSAKEVADTCGMSLPTVYRRINLLMDHGLVSEQLVVSDDGNHYKEYAINFDSTVITLDGDEFDVRVYRRENLPDGDTDR